MKIFVTILKLIGIKSDPPPTPEDIKKRIEMYEELKKIISKLGNGWGG